MNYNRSLRPVSFLVPGISSKFRCGGLNVALQSCRIVQNICPSQIVTYREREGGYPFLADEIKKDIDNSMLWIISWGYDVKKLLKILKGRAIAYHAHSCGYNFQIPTGIPIFAASKSTLGYWGSKAGRNPLFLIQNCLEPQWINKGARAGNIQRVQHKLINRNIDVLIQERKNSKYVLKKLVPALRKQGLTVKVLENWVENLVDLFNNSKIFIYDSADFWNQNNLTEGFGLPPLEAISCGCVLFSSVNHALADFINPGVIGHQIGIGHIKNDIERITDASRNPEDWATSKQETELLISKLNETNLLKNWGDILIKTNEFFDKNLKDKEAFLVRNRKRSYLQNFIK